MNAFEEESIKAGWTIIDEKKLWLDTLTRVARGGLQLSVAEFQWIYETYDVSWAPEMNQDQILALARVQTLVEDIFAKYTPNTAPPELLERYGFSFDPPDSTDS